MLDVHAWADPFVVDAHLTFRATACIASSIDGPELIRGHGKQLYVVYPNGIGRSPLTAAVIERALGGRVSTGTSNSAVAPRRLARRFLIRAEFCELGPGCVDARRSIP